MMHYKFSFDSFNNLVEKLTPFLKFECINLMRPQLEIDFFIKIVLYRFDVGAVIIHKYVDVICDVLCDNNKLLGKYINAPFGDCLLHIIQQF
jgi:hypothetical protein